MYRRSTNLLTCLTLSCLLGAAAWAGPAEEARLDMVSRQIVTSPFDAQLYLQRALIHSDMGLEQQAFADVNRAEELGDPQDAALVHAILCYRQGQFAQAEDLVNRFLLKYPHHVGALDYRARILRDAGKTGPAAIAYLALLDQQPNSPPGTYLSASELLAAEQGPEAAIALLDRRIEQVGPVSQLQRPAIALEIQRGNYPAAIARLGSLHDSIRATPQWHLEMAEVLLLNGDEAQAVPHLQVASEQLAVLRPTPARVRAYADLDRLRADYAVRLENR